jgi:hypothetical protein
MSDKNNFVLMRKRSSVVEQAEASAIQTKARLI